MRVRDDCIFDETRILEFEGLWCLWWCSPLARSAKPTRTRATVLTDGTAARFSRATQTVSSIGEPSFSPK